MKIKVITVNVTKGDFLQFLGVLYLIISWAYCATVIPIINLKHTVEISTDIVLTLMLMAGGGAVAVCILLFFMGYELKLEDKKKEV